MVRDALKGVSCTESFLSPEIGHKTSNDSCLSLIDLMTYINPKGGKEEKPYGLGLAPLGLSLICSEHVDDILG